MLSLTKKKFWITFPLLLSIAITLLIVLLSKRLPLKLPLFYSLSWGEKQLASHQQFIIIHASITLIALFNLIISWQLHPQQDFFKKVLLFSSILVSLILTITFVKIVLIFI